MEFDKSRVYTSLNAEELKPGDKVITANCLANLKTYVVADAPAKEILAIHDDTNLSRFEVEHPRGSYTAALAYLVERKENCFNCGSTCGYEGIAFRKDKTCNNWQPKAEPKTERPELVSLGNGQYAEKPQTETCDTCLYTTCGMKGVAQGKGCGEWKPKTESNCTNCKAKGKWEVCKYEPVSCQFYEAEKHYRPFKDTDELVKVWEKKVPCNRYRPANTMPLIWVREKGCEKSADLITCFGSKGITVRGKGVYFDTLFTMFEFLDGSPCGELCGVEE